MSEPTKTIHIVCGRVCSGKTTYALDLVAKIDASYIKVSTIVRQLTGFTDRDALQTTAGHLSAICELLDGSVTTGLTARNDVVVDGIRQPEIIEYLIVTYGLDRIRIHWCDPGLAVRKHRYSQRSREIDLQASFEAADAGDNALGLHIVERIARTLVTIHN